MENEKIPEKYGRNNFYATTPGKRSLFPTPVFLWGMCAGPMAWLNRMARQNKCDDAKWVQGSIWLANIFEGIGGRIIVEGLDNLDLPGGEPCVFVANHMSALETFLLPAMSRPRMPVTYVVKKSLMTMPFFGPIMRSRDPVAVGRASPREDLATVLAEGAKRLQKGISIIVFPQSTRSLHFEPEHFNTIGIKLACKAKAPVVPIALKTDAWGHGKYLKDLGRIRPELPARFRFGEPIRISGRGKAEHGEICQFIQSALDQWHVENAASCRCSD